MKANDWLWRTLKVTTLEGEGEVERPTWVPAYRQQGQSPEHHYITMSLA